MKGYYSVMQYCPDLSRAEAANVGVVLFTENPLSLSVKTSETFNRVKRFFKPDDRQFARIVDAVRANAARLAHEIDEVSTAVELNHLARTMGNDIRLTTPLVVQVSDPQIDLLKLYDELVGDSVAVSNRRVVVLPTSINQTFETLVKQNKMIKPGTILVPLISRKLHIPYAYRNGVLNYVKPTVFVNESDTSEKAARLAVEGDQIQKHPISDLNGQIKRRLIVVSSASSDLRAEEKVAPLFAEYGVQYITQQTAQKFADKVLQEAK